MPTVSYNRQLRVKLAIIFGLTLTLAIPTGFGRSRIRRNCVYTLLYAGFLFLSANCFKDSFVLLILKIVSELDLSGNPFLKPEIKSEIFWDGGKSSIIFFVHKNHIVQKN